MLCLLRVLPRLSGPGVCSVQALEEAEETRRQSLAKAAHQREQELAEERERKERLSREDARNREEERARKAEEHQLQVNVLPIYAIAQCFTLCTAYCVYRHLFEGTVIEWSGGVHVWFDRSEYQEFKKHLGQYHLKEVLPRYSSS